jgi:hypothetical protein
MPVRAGGLRAGGGRSGTAVDFTRGWGDCQPFCRFGTAVSRRRPHSFAAELARLAGLPKAEGNQQISEVLRLSCDFRYRFVPLPIAINAKRHVPKNVPRRGFSICLRRLVAALELHQEFEEFQVEPGERDEQREGAVPFHVLGGALLNSLFDEIEVEDKA